ncbi:ankyrin repeat-containing domain protein [Russula dissimulans]|nr:ankyrin repeat-containing domain protein [Russula dissimulans]
MMLPENVDESIAQFMDDKGVVTQAALNHDAPSRRGTVESNGRNAQGEASNVELNIFTAAQQGRTELIRGLIESGRASAKDRDVDDVTPLHWAAVNDRLETCAYLIEQGAEVNAPGGEIRAPPLQWAGREGYPEVIDLLIRKGADPCLLDVDGYSCIFAVTNSRHYWAVLYVLLQPGVAVDARDKKGRTPLHWATYQGDEVSMAILFKMGANPNVGTWEGLTPLHLAAFTKNESCIAMLLEAGADVTAKYRDKTAGEMLRGLRRPGSELGVKIIVFAVPSISLCVAFTIASVFPWYMSVLFSPAALAVMHYVVTYEILPRDPHNHIIRKSPYLVGYTFGTALWVAYAWVTRLRHGTTRNPAMHAAFLIFFVLSTVALLYTILSDPGMCRPSPPRREDLKPILERHVQNGSLTAKFCVVCILEKPPHTEHCPFCKQCITYRKFSIHHHLWIMPNCIGVKNYKYFIFTMVSIIACVSFFDYLSWTHLLSSKNASSPRFSCLLPHALCRLTSAETFLISIAVWSTLQVLAIIVLIFYETETCQKLMLQLGNLVDTITWGFHT